MLPAFTWSSTDPDFPAARNSASTDSTSRGSRETTFIGRYHPAVRYDYTLLGQVMGIRWADGTVLSHGQAILDQGSDWLATVQEQLDDLDGGGWEVVSHHLLAVEDGAVLTVLARREST